jgi:hypothetical protein
MLIAKLMTPSFTAQINVVRATTYSRQTSYEALARPCVEKLPPALAQPGNYPRFGLVGGTDRAHAFNQLSSVNQYCTYHVDSHDTGTKGTFIKTLYCHASLWITPIPVQYIVLLSRVITNSTRVQPLEPRPCSVVSTTICCSLDNGAGRRRRR